MPEVSPEAVASFIRKIWNSTVVKMPGPRTAAAPPPTSTRRRAQAMRMSDLERAAVEDSSAMPVDVPSDYQNVGNMPQGTPAPHATEGSPPAVAPMPPPAPQHVGGGEGGEPHVPPEYLQRAEEFSTLRKQVEDDFFRFIQVLSEKDAQPWREALTRASNLANKKPAAYEEAIAMLKDIQEQLDGKRDQLHEKAFMNVCDQLDKTFLSDTAPLLGQSRYEELGKEYLELYCSVLDGSFTHEEGSSRAVKLYRDLNIGIDKELDKIRGVLADYERILPIVARAEALEIRQSEAASPQQAPPHSDSVAQRFVELDSSLKRLPMFQEFFSRQSHQPHEAQPASPLSLPRLKDVKEAVAKGFGGAYQDVAIGELDKSLRELERVACQQLSQLDVDAEIAAQRSRLPANPEDLKLGDRLAGGNFADTYKLQWRADTAVEGQAVVAKVLKLTGSEEEREKARKALDDEARVYALLGDHDNIVKCYGVVELEDRPALVMEAVTGGTLDSVMDDLENRYNEGKVSREQYVGAMQHLIRGTLSGLAQFEALGLTHLDMKGDNVLFDPVTQQAKVIDVGLTQKHGALGAPAVPVKWTPPEFKGKTDEDQVKTQWDSFSFGQTLHRKMERQLFGHGGVDPKSKQPWEVEPDEHIFVPGKGTKQAAYVTNKEYGEGLEAMQNLENAKEEQKIPLTRIQASDQKGPGKYGMESAYVDFMIGLLHADPKKRLSPSEALRHPFLTQSLLDAEEVKKLFAPATSSSAEASHVTAGPAEASDVTAGPAEASDVTAGPAEASNVTAGPAKVDYNT